MSYADWNKDDSGGKRIYTFYELQPTEVLKGNVTPSSSITMRELGGEKDGVGLNVPGVAQIERGEDAIVFLKERNSGGSYDIQGMMMGKYNIQVDGEGTEYLTGMGLNNFDHSVNNPVGAPSSPPPKKWALNDLRQLIRSQADSDSRSEVSAASNNTRQESDRRPKTPSSPTALAQQASPTPTQEPDPQTSSLAPSDESVENSSPGFSYFWISLLTLGGAIGLWQYNKSRRKS